MNLQNGASVLDALVLFNYSSDCLPKIMSFKQKLKSCRTEEKTEKITIRWSKLRPL